LHIVDLTDTFYTVTSEAWNYPCVRWEERCCLDLGDWITPDDSTEEDKDRVQTYVCLGRSTLEAPSEDFDLPVVRVLTGKTC
jgi:hypothetical protein